METDKRTVILLTEKISKPDTILVHDSNDVDANTMTSELGPQTSSRQHKMGESMIISDWVQKTFFKYCKCVTCLEELEYGQPFSEFALEENNVPEEKQKWWNKHKKEIV